MFKVGDYIIYKKDVCRIKDINDNTYILIPILDDSLKIEVPINSPFLRKPISKEEVMKIIEEKPNIPVIEENDRIIEGTYKEYIKNGTYRDLVSVIKTTYLRNKKRKDDKKKISDRDLSYFDLAEKLLYSEFSIALNISYDETKEFVLEHVDKNKNS